ncbi:hypothetical protein GPALN_005795 [Globodera pallida]|nr:hypothetical protein GPALN_005795 [Globodera pallida]
MSDHPREAERPLKKLNVSNDVLFGVFPFVGHNDLGLKVAPLSVRFDALVDKYFNVAKWAFGPIEIRRATNGNGMAIRKRGQIVPTADCPLPAQIIGFRHILIRYIDHNSIAFVQQIERLFCAGICFKFDIDLGQTRGWSAVAQKIWPFLASSISCLTIDDHQLSGLQMYISTTVLRDCANLRSIDFHKQSYYGGGGGDGMAMDHDYDDIDDSDEFDDDGALIGIMAEMANQAMAELNDGVDNGMPAADQQIVDNEANDALAGEEMDDWHNNGANVNAWPGRALSGWLHLPRADGCPKLLKYVCTAHQTEIDIELLKEAFITNTSSPVSYIVRLEAKLVDVEPFEMENPQTRELFTLRRVYNDLWFLERGPVEREQSSWDLDRATLKCGWEEQQSVIKIAIYDDDDVGPLSAPAVDAPSNENE